MTLETLRSLQTRIREATGADRELDFDIGDLIKIPPHEVTPHYTTDPDGLGACVALMHATLPGRHWKRDYDGDIFLRGGGYARPLANDCLTFIDAIMSAVIAEEEQEKANV